MNTLIEQLVIKELESLVTSGDAEKLISTLVGYLERVAPEVAKLWSEALSKIVGSSTPTTSSTPAAE